jgi:steroid 5-alpha reductase family enzyme
LGVDPASNLSVFLFCAIFTFAVVTILWVVGLVRGDHSMMDGWYGFAFAVPALLA